MTASAQEVVFRLACSRAGLSPAQIEALQRGDLDSLVALSERDGSRGSDNETRDLAVTRKRLRAAQLRAEAALALLAQLAARLGCCHRCWGSDTTCPICAGRGAPGFFAPDPYLEEWVGPALDRIGLAPPKRTAAPATPPEQMKYDEGGMT